MFKVIVHFALNVNMSFFIVEPMRIGILGVQGAVSEHVGAFERAFSDMGVRGTVDIVRNANHIHQIDALVIPGGESSTISRIMDTLNLRKEILSRIEQGIPVMGTCAGAVLLASEGDEAVRRSGTKLLGSVEVSVKRNAFGGQRESFESNMNIKGIAEGFHAVFIRAPSMELLPSSRARVLATFEDKLVGVEQNNILSFSFHPELTRDPRIHRYFLEKLL